MAHLLKEDTYFLCKSPVVTQVLHLVVPSVLQYVVRLSQVEDVLL